MRTVLTHQANRRRTSLSRRPIASMRRARRTLVRPPLLGQEPPLVEIELFHVDGGSIIHVALPSAKFVVAGGRTRASRFRDRRSSEIHRPGKSPDETTVSVRSAACGSGSRNLKREVREGDNRVDLGGRSGPGRSVRMPATPPTPRARPPRWPATFRNHVPTSGAMSASASSRRRYVERRYSGTPGRSPRRTAGDAKACATPIVLREREVLAERLVPAGSTNRSTRVIPASHHSTLVVRVGVPHVPGLCDRNHRVRVGRIDMGFRDSSRREIVA